MQPVVHTLSNGLTVLFVETNTFPSFTAMLLVGAGSRYENEKNNGIAHFFEHMAFKGTNKYPNSLAIASTVEGLGGVFNAFTDKDHTGYWIKAPTRHYETVIDVISDMILNPLLESEEIEREKGVIIEEMNLYEDTPYRKVGDLFEELLYAGSPLGFEIIGTRETVSSFDRKTFTDYIGDLYTPSNAVLIVAGGFKGTPYEKTYLDILEGRFGTWKRGEPTTFTKVVEEQSRPLMRVKHKKTEQAHFCLGFRTFPFFDRRRYVLSVLSAILGGGMSSRLFIEVRERRGLCYYISTAREFYQDVGNIVTQAGVTNSAEKVNEAVKVTLEQYASMANAAIPADELQRAKEMIKGRLVLSLEDSHSIASFVGTRQLLEKKQTTPEEIAAEIDSVTAEQIAALAKEFFTPQNLNFAIVGPFAEEDFKLDYTL
jgi:predicted Zn-dependent peptidase